jgi:hypothetical protein
MFEKLIPGDQVMCIPASDDIGGVMLIPYGTCGVVVQGEALHDGLTFHGKEIIKICCVVRFESHLCPFHPSGNWLRVRPGLMKITPEEQMKEEETEVMAEDALPPLLTVNQLRQLFAER